MMKHLHDNYSPYKTIDFAKNMGIIVTDKDDEIIAFNDMVNCILKVQLQKQKNLNNYIPIPSLSYRENCIDTDFFETPLAFIYKQFNPKLKIFTYLLFGNETRELLRQINTKIAELEIIFEQSTDGIFITDGDGIVLNVNPADEKKCMMPRSEMIGKDIRKLVADKVFYPSAALKVIETKKQCVITQTTKNGQTVITTGTPIFDENENLARVLCNNVDYNELIELKENLEIAERLQRYYKTHSNVEHYRKLAGDDFLAKSKKMIEILDIIENMSEIDPTVLISGDSGVGKSLIAKKIHLYSPFKHNDFIEINCGAIPEHLLESELFGYVKGAFTGASHDGKVGLIELANNGTLFLDEIGDLPLNLQVKLLHVIQNKKIRRVGSTQNTSINTRIISASNKNLAEMVKKGSFREDLYYRLNVVPIVIPPLRDRKEEIPDLLSHYLAIYNKQYSFKKTFHPSTISGLIDYSWPGNIRELINLVERLMVTSVGDTITTDMLPLEISEEIFINVNNISTNTTLEKAKETLEKNMLMNALKKSRNSYEIAEILGIGQSSVVRKLQKYKLNQFLGGNKENN